MSVHWLLVHLSLHHWHTSHMLLLLTHHHLLLLTTFDDLIDFLQLFALFLTQLSNHSQHGRQINLLLIECFLHLRHHILDRIRLRLQSYQFLRHSIFSLHNLAHRFSRQFLSTFILSQDFLNLSVFLL